MKIITDNTQVILNLQKELDEANFKNNNLVNALIFYSKFSDSRISEVAKIALAMKEGK